jgi:hypothetical protein
MYGGDASVEDGEAVCSILVESEAPPDGRRLLREGCLKGVE